MFLHYKENLWGIALTTGEDWTCDPVIWNIKQNIRGIIDSK
jgi:hypothetical protein